MHVREKVVIVTGASSGIGAALAQELSRRGAKLALVARNKDALQIVAADCAGAVVIPTDITQREACIALVDETVGHFGKLDVLVNNAGLSMLSRFEDIQDFSLLKTLMDVNYFGAMYCTHAALPHLKHSQGLIVGISSLAGKTGVPLRTGYAASKHAMQGFFDSLRIELMGSGVDVTVISPAFVSTEIREHSLGADGQPLGRDPLKGRLLMSAEECARQIADAIESRRRELLMESKGKLLLLGKMLLPGLVDRLTYRTAYRE